MLSLVVHAWRIADNKCIARVKGFGSFFLLRLQKIDRKKQVKYFIILSTYYFKSTKICVCINDSETKKKQPSFL